MRALMKGVMVRLKRAGKAFIQMWHDEDAMGRAELVIAFAICVVLIFALGAALS